MRACVRALEVIRTDLNEVLQCIRVCNYYSFVVILILYLP